jgi:integrase
MAGPRVSVQRTIGTYRRKDGGRSYRVRWTVAGKAFGRGFSHRAQADYFHASLIHAIGQLERFDRRTGLPPSLTENPNADATLVDLAREVVRLNWEDWSPAHRRGMVTAYDRLLTSKALLIEGARLTHRASVRSWFMDGGLMPGELRPITAQFARKGVTEKSRQDAADQLAAWSLPAADLDSVACTAAMHEASVLDNEDRAARDQVTALRIAMRHVSKRAVARKLLVVNPMLEATSPGSSTPEDVDARLVPSPAQARLIIDAVANYDSSRPSQAQGPRYARYLAFVFLTGCRPSEAMGLRVGPDLVLPDEGWGRVTFRAALVSPGGRWTDDGETHHQTAGLKGRNVSKPRVVPLHPAAVAACRAAIEADAIPVGGLVFRAENGNALTHRGVNRQWKRGLLALPEDSPVRDATPYHLRHAHITAMLRGGDGRRAATAAEVAARVGNSATTIQRAYSSVIDELQPEVDAALGGMAGDAGW